LIYLLLAPGCERTVVPGQVIHEGWWKAAWRFRSSVVVPAADYDREDILVSVKADLDNDLARLGLRDRADRNSVRIIEVGDEKARPLPCAWDDGRLFWMMQGKTPRGMMRAFHIYYDTVSASKDLPKSPPPRLEHGAAAGDYAAQQHGDAWDFDEGDFEGIVSWGNKPECIPHKEVKDGCLRLKIKGDGYFIWGKMWGEITDKDRVESIDLRKYRLLKIRARQSVRSAEWEIFGRPEDTDSLLHYKFWVGGPGWRKITIDLRDRARWSGKLIAFRIDPAQVDAGAEVEIDWVRLSNEVTAERMPTVTYGLCDKPPVRLELSGEQPRPQVASEQKVIVTAFDESGGRVRGADVTLELRGSKDGLLKPEGGSKVLAVSGTCVHGLTDQDGKLSATYVAGTKAGLKEVVMALATIQPGPSALFEAVAAPGPPEKYLVSPGDIFWREDRQPVPVTAQAADRFGNPLALAGRKIKWSLSPGGMFTARDDATDEAGAARARFNFDAKAGTVVRVSVTDDRGMAGRSKEIVMVRTRRRENPIVLGRNGYFCFKDGKQFVPLGGFYANWVHKRTADGVAEEVTSFVEVSDAELSEYLRFLHENGVTAVRLMLRAHRPGGTEPMDIGGAVNPDLYAKVQRYMELAEPYGIKFLLVIHEDYTKPMYYDAKRFELFALPHYEGTDLDRLPECRRRFIRDRRFIKRIERKYTDPDVIKCQEMYTRDLIPKLRNLPGLFAYELENEMVNCPASWANRMIGAIRSDDGVTPVCVSHGGGGLHTADPLWWFKNTRIDFYTYHLYPHAWCTTEEIDYGMAADILTRYGRMAGPCFLGESVGDQFRRYPDKEERKIFGRDLIWMSLVNGNPGCFFWNMYPDVTAEFAAAKEILSHLDLSSFERAVPEIGIDVSHPLGDDKYYRTEQGRADYEMMGRYVRASLDSGIDFDFTTDPGRYAGKLSIKRFEPPAPRRRYFTVSPPYQLRYLASKDYGEILVYARNAAGIRSWLTTLGKRPIKQFLRARGIGTLAVRFDLPRDSYHVTLYNLDTRRNVSRKCSGRDSIRIPNTRDDYVILFVTLAKG